MDREFQIISNGYFYVHNTFISDTNYLLAYLSSRLLHYPIAKNNKTAIYSYYITNLCNLLPNHKCLITSRCFFFFLEGINKYLRHWPALGSTFSLWYALFTDWGNDIKLDGGVWSHQGVQRQWGESGWLWACWALAASPGCSGSALPTNRWD